MNEPRQRTRYFDAAGNPTDDPGEVASGEIIAYDVHGRPLKRTRFFLEEREIEWLPVSEPALLLWVFAALFAIWVAVAVVLHLT